MILKENRDSHRSQNAVLHHVFGKQKFFILFHSLGQVLHMSKTGVYMLGSLRFFLRKPKK